MKITHIGGATAIIEHNGKRILFDPWLDDGIFHGSWYHFPPIEMTIEQLGRFDYVFISHIHEDHCSKGTIKYLNRDAEIILMDRQPNLVGKFLDVNGFKFKKTHLIKPKTPTEIAPGLVADMLTADPAHEYNHYIDSGLILKWDNFVIYNANDCAPYEDGMNYLLKHYPQIDLALIPYAGGSGYPACYLNLSEEEKYAEARRINDSCLSVFVNAYEKLKPRCIMPFADQYVISGSRAHLNKYLPHPAGPGAVYEPMKRRGYESKLLLLNSGQSFDFKTMTKTPSTPYHFSTDAERNEYIEKTLLSRKYEYELFDLNHGVAIERLFKYARGRMWEEQKKHNYFPSFKYYFEVKDRKRLFVVDLCNEGLEEVKFDSPREQPYLLLSGPSGLFVHMLIGQISWNIADAALFIDYERVPNRYDPETFVYVNFMRI